MGSMFEVLAARAGSSALGERHRAVAAEVFGPHSERPVSYLAFRRAMDAAAGSGTAGHALGLLDVHTRARAVDGELSPAEILRRVAEARADWRYSAAPIPRQALHGYLKSESRLRDVDLALAAMDRSARERFHADEMDATTFAAWADKGRRRDVDVVIVGAGMAGLAAANALMASGYEVVVLEARAQPGGRASTDDGAFRVPFDNGCAWIHSAPENPLFSLVHRRGFETIADDEPMLVLGAGNELLAGDRLSKRNAEMFDACVRAGEAGRDVSCQAIVPDEDPWSRAAAAIIGPLEFGVDFASVSSRDLYRVRPEVDDHFVPQGLGTFVESFTHGVPIEFETPVSSIRWTPASGVQVTANDTAYKGRSALVTVSTGFLATGRIEFEPPLPDWKNEAIRSLPMGNYDKIALTFSKNVFPQSIQPSTRLRQLANPEAPLDFVLRPFGEPMALGFVGGTFARALGPRPEREKVELALSVLERAFGPHLRDALVNVKTTAWGEDPWTRGSYSAALPGRQHARSQLARPLEHTLFFAGEACHETWGQHLTGAYLSGLDSAKAISAALRSRSGGGDAVTRASHQRSSSAS